MRISQNKFRTTGFSLVEVVLALGICSFAMVAIIGMIPVGLNTFHTAMNTTVQSQIVQRLAGEILMQEYANLPTKDAFTYYNEQGAVLETPDGTVAYTAKVTPPKTIAATPGEKVTISIALTHPGQTFETIETATPNQIYAYSVVVSKNK